MADSSKLSQLYADLVDRFDEAYKSHFRRELRHRPSHEFAEMFKESRSRTPSNDLLEEIPIPTEGGGLNDYLRTLLSCIEDAAREYNCPVRQPTLAVFSPDWLARATVRYREHGFLILVNLGLTFLHSHVVRIFLQSTHIVARTHGLWLPGKQADYDASEAGWKIGRAIFRYVTDMEPVEAIRETLDSRWETACLLSIRANHFVLAHEYAHLLCGHIKEAEPAAIDGINSLPQIDIHAERCEWLRELRADAYALLLMLPPSIRNSVDPRRLELEANYGLLGAINAILVSYLIELPFHSEAFRRLIEVDTRFQDLAIGETLRGSKYPPEPVRAETLMRVAADLLPQSAVDQAGQYLLWFNDMAPAALAFVQFLSERVLNEISRKGAGEDVCVQREQE